MENIKISFNNLDFKNQIKLPKNNIKFISNINKILNNLPALNIVKDKNLLENTIKEVKEFSKNKKSFIVFTRSRSRSRPVRSPAPHTTLSSWLSLICAHFFPPSVISDDQVNLLPRILLFLIASQASPNWLHRTLIVAFIPFRGIVMLIMYKHRTSVSHMVSTHLILPKPELDVQWVVFVFVSLLKVRRSINNIEKSLKSSRAIHIILVSIS